MKAALEYLALIKAEPTPDVAELRDRIYRSLDPDTAKEFPQPHFPFIGEDVPVSVAAPAAAAPAAHAPYQGEGASPGFLNDCRAVCSLLRLPKQDAASKAGRRCLRGCQLGNLLYWALAMCSSADRRSAWPDSL